MQAEQYFRSDKASEYLELSSYERQEMVKLIMAQDAGRAAFEIGRRSNTSAIRRLKGQIPVIPEKTFGKKIDNPNINVTSNTLTSSNGATVGTRPIDSPNYSVVFEVQLPNSAYPGVSRQRHNQMANQTLHEAFEADPSFANQMENLYPGIVNGVRPGTRGAFPRTAPTPDVTYHHGQRPGQLQLVPRDQHESAGVVQDSLHPDGRGGFSSWGVE